MGGHLSNLKVDKNSEIFEASCGPIRGNIYHHENNKIVDGYLGIPYAQPPARFQRAILAQNWTDPLDCYKYGPNAPQTGLVPDLGQYGMENIIDEEKCLSLNIFVPRGGEKSKAVMVFIHGGGFELGSSGYYCHKSVSGSLPLKDIILVTINYRLGVLGFLTTGQQNCPGNLGLWDQTLALEWIQKHIESFGGNPKNVTIFGQSAGGASCDLLSLSPKSRDLFSKIIPMSGSAMCSFAMRTKENQVNVFEEFAEFLGAQKGQDLVEFFKTKSIEELTKIEKFKKSASGGLTFIPNFDGDFFPRPLDVLRKEQSQTRPIKILTGICELEGLILAILDPSNSTALEKLTKNVGLNLREDLLGEKAEKIRKEVFDFYLNEAENVAENELEIKKKTVEFVGDWMFNLGILESARNSAKHGNDTFLYEFDFCNPEGFGMFQQILPVVAATHCTDLRYVLGEGVYSKFDASTEDLQMFQTMTKIFSDFAKTGNPGWPKFDISDQKFKRINLPEVENLEKIENFGGGRCEKLKKIVLENDRCFNSYFYGEERSGSKI